jgi:hypothetical protein
MAAGGEQCGRCLRDDEIHLEPNLHSAAARDLLAASEIPNSWRAATLQRVNQGEKSASIKVRKMAGVGGWRA